MTTVHKTPGTLEKSAWGLGFCLKPPKEVTGGKAKSCHQDPQKPNPTGSETSCFKNKGKAGQGSRVDQPGGDEIKLPLHHIEAQSKNLPT